MNNLEFVIKENVGLIWEISKKFYNTNKADLYQAGVLGIIKAYQNYAKDGDAKFSTYAYKYIYGEMYMVAMSKTIRQSKDLLKLVKMIEQGKNRLAQEIMREPTNEELSRYLEIDINDLEMALASSVNVVSMDEDSDDTRCLYDVVAKNEEVSVDDKILINDGINKLNPLERDIINSRYFDDLTQSETAKKLGITQVMVSRYEQKSLNKMRKFMYM